MQIEQFFINHRLGRLSRLGPKEDVVQSATFCCVKTGDFS